MNWTKEQQKTIELRDKNILVSAAAGSGKTAVLVERIKRIVLEEGCPIDKMLIVTFTNAAASEMKEKIEKSINSLIGEMSESLENAEAEEREKIEKSLAFLKKQTELLQTANISTFHAFALEIIKRYFYLIDIEPNLKICDNNEQVLMKGKAIEKLLDELFEENSPEFLDFLNKYSGDRNENKFKELVSKGFDTIQSLPEPYLWLEQCLAGFNQDIEAFKRGNICKYIWHYAKTSIKEPKEELLQYVGIINGLGWSRADQMISQDIEFICGLDELVERESFNQVVDFLKTNGVARINAHAFKRNKEHLGEKISDFELESLADKYKSIHARIKNIKDTLEEEFFNDTIEKQYQELVSTKESISFYIRCIKRYKEIYQDIKGEKGLIDFNDIEHYAIQILKDEEASGYYREKFNHIFIDEYQDSNIVQETLISMIKRDNNLFMVGDVKQSIYKFRLAEPEIFQRKYKEFKEEMEEKGLLATSESIDLNNNFRSKRPVIDFVNRMFYAIMEGYDESAALKVGDVYGDRCCQSPHLYLAKTQWDIDEEKQEEQAEDDEFITMLKAEKEALACVKIIKENLGKPVFISKENVERPLKLKDIVILMRAVKDYGDIFYRVFTENNIPAYIDDNDGFFNTIEINLMLSLLAIIDNQKQDLHLLTVLKSEIFGFSIDELARIRIANKDCSYYMALKAYSMGEGEEIDEELRIKVLDFFSKLQRWKEESKIIPLEEMVWSLIVDTGLYVFMGAMPSGSQRQANLRALVDKALFYRKNQGGSLYGFISYIDAVKLQKIPMGQVKLIGEDEDTVRIMTIHKSKGLEFPMVIVSGFCKRLNYTKVGRSMVIHKEFGIGLPVVNYKDGWYKKTLLQRVVSSMVKKEEADEQYRILYVALTRAKDFLFLLGICKDPESEIEKILNGESSPSSFITMLRGKNAISHGHISIIEDDELKDVKTIRKRQINKALEYLDNDLDEEKLKKEPGYEQVKSRMEFSYPYVKQLSIKSKYSVSELNEIENDRRAKKNIDCKNAEYKRTDIEPKENTSISKAQIGVIVHKVLELLDFNKAISQGSLYVNELLEDMVRKEYINSQEAECVDIESIVKFAKSPLGDRISKSPLVYRETPFTLVKEVEGENTFVQGIIDCFFLEDDNWVLVDYKTTNISNIEQFNKKKEDIASNYKKQIELYKEALEKAKGKKVKEAYLYLTNIGETILM